MIPARRSPPGLLSATTAVLTLFFLINASNFLSSSGLMSPSMITKKQPGMFLHSRGRASITAADAAVGRVTTPSTPASAVAARNFSGIVAPCSFQAHIHLNSTQNRPVSRFIHSIV